MTTPSVKQGKQEAEQGMPRFDREGPRASRARSVTSNLRDNVVDAETAVLQNCAGVSEVQGYNYRTIAGTGKLSDHALGLAVDFIVPRCSKYGDNITDFLLRYHDQFGIKYIIWNEKIYSARNGWKGRAYGHPGGFSDDTRAHRDHVHVSFHGGGVRPDGIRAVFDAGASFVKDGLGGSFFSPTFFYLIMEQKYFEEQKKRDKEIQGKIKLAEEEEDIYNSSPQE